MLQELNLAEHKVDAISFYYDEYVDDELMYWRKMALEPSLAPLQVPPVWGRWAN